MRGLSTFFVALATLAAPAQAQVSLPAIGVAATETFDAFRGAGFTTTPAADQLDSDAWIVNGLSDGAMSFGDTRTTGDFARGASAGGVTTGGVYGFDVGAGNYTLGIQPGGADFTPGSVVLRVRNDTAMVITSLSVSFRGYVLNDQNRSTVVTTEHSADGTTFVPYGTTFTSPGPPAGGWLFLPGGATITGLAIAPGALYFLRWSSDDAGGAGARDELGLDLVSVAAATGTPPCMSDTDCADSNPCTVDTCMAGVCSNAPAPPGTSCSDGNACNGVETCAMTRCMPGAPPVCDDGNVCTTDGCAPATGCTNVAVADGSPCLDADMCNGAEACTAGSCGAGTPLDCDDANACTADSCDMTTGCANAPVAAGTTCDDADMCNGAEVCDAAGSCQAGTALDCDDANPCTDDTCDMTTGCANAPVAEGTACEDGDACNGAETCSASGECAGGAVLDCDDGDVCTDDSCDTTTGCVNDPIPMCVGSDGGTGTDGGSTGGDGSVSADAGPETMRRSDTGCGCRTTRDGEPATGWLLAAVALLALARRRRKPR